MRCVVGTVGIEGDVNEIQRYGGSRRWADVVVHRGVAHWVEVAEDTSAEIEGQSRQVLAQIDATLVTLHSDRTKLLQVLVYLADRADAATFDEIWDAWVPEGHPPVRAVVQAGLGSRCRVEVVVMAAVKDV